MTNRTTLGGRTPVPSGEIVRVPTDSPVFRVDANDRVPPYVQLERHMRVAVADGVFKPGAVLPSIRNVARQMGVSVHTVARAYAGLSRQGVIVGRAVGGSAITARDQCTQSVQGKAIYQSRHGRSHRGHRPRHGSRLGDHQGLRRAPRTERGLGSDGIDQELGGATERAFSTNSVNSRKSHDPVAHHLSAGGRWALQNTFSRLLKYVPRTSIATTCCMG